MLIDTHCHLDLSQFDPDREAVLARAAAAGVQRIIIPAIDLTNAPTILRLAEQHEMLFAAVGVHPNASAAWQPGWLDQIRALANHAKVVAIGEIGLDYYRDYAPPAVQQEAFTAQLALAHELGLPVIIHNREADEDIVRLLQQASQAGTARPGVLHSFAAPLPVAEAVLALGFYLGFTGPLTFKQADGLRHLAAQLPLDRLLVETDAPFLAPQQKRGRRNEPAYVAYVAERLAALHGLDAAAMSHQTSQNAIRLFGSQLAP